MGSPSSLRCTRAPTGIPWAPWTPGGLLGTLADARPCLGPPGEPLGHSGALKDSLGRLTMLTLRTEAFPSRGALACSHASGILAVVPRPLYISGVESPAVTHHVVIHSDVVY